MSESSRTPETDAAFKEFNDGSNTAYVRMTVHAKKLEQQRDAALERERGLREALQLFSDLDRNVPSDLWAINPQYCEQARAALAAKGEK